MIIVWLQIESWLVAASLKAFGELVHFLYAVSKIMLEFVVAEYSDVI